ncbi:pantetheine-phosphate adenylyltransferase [Gammaproteobacteria bacterium]|nr:pantetheine-phosphate adenylyltransferase [Gammaproteobacteria bacterium]
MRDDFASKKVVYSGTFDPLTNGHLDLIKRATLIFPKVILAISQTSAPSKQPLFSISERVELARRVLQDYSTVEVLSFNGLLVDFLKDINANIIIRGLRRLNDFEYECQMASVNQHLNPDIETIFLPAAPHTKFISSTMVKELAHLNADVKRLVHPIIFAALTAKLQIK